MEPEIFGLGKLPMEHLRVLLERYGGEDERLVVGPRVGEDAAVVDMGNRYIVLKSDPITFATDEIGWYVVHVNANDIATMGGTPKWLLLTLLLPEKKTDAALVEEILDQASQACRALGIVLCGGHTEITHGLDRPIAVGLMLGEAEKEDLVRTAGAQPGDEVILTKGIAIEGTAVLANELGEELATLVDPDLVDRARRFLKEPGISVLREAEIVRQVGRPTSMHDPTEGGLATGLWELSQASGKGIEIDLAFVHLYPETEALCGALGLDPLGTLASGALLLTASSKDAEQMVRALESAAIPAARIGRVTEGPSAVQMRDGSSLAPLPSFARDELARLFEESP